jgi:uncharacterized protein YkwD
VKRVLVVLALITLVGAGLTCGVARASDLAPTSVCPVGSRTQMLCLHNYTRKQHGLKPLTPMSALTTAARRKAGDIERTGLFSHDPTGVGVWRYFPASLPYTMGENLVYGYVTVRDLYTAWLNSPGHFHNIINPAFRYYGSYFVWSARLPHLCVVDFGG